jgi:hypothetical protein
MQIFFCNDDIECCMKDTRWKWIMSKTDVPNNWLVKIGTNLSRKEILDLENANFSYHSVFACLQRDSSGRRSFHLTSLPTPL